jgi:microcystin-dependent protein
MFAGSFAPQGWLFCDGQLLPIADNDTLFNLIGTTYGGDGQTTFALPDLRGRIPIHQGAGHTLAESGGAETQTLTRQQMPPHSHQLAASNDPADPLVNPGGSLLARTAGTGIYDPNITVPMGAQAIGISGASSPHENMAPYQCVSFIIAVAGVFPSQN